MQGWEGQGGGKGHKDFCSKAIDERKVKNTAIERKQAEKDSVKETYVKLKEANKEVGKETIKEVAKMYKEMRKSKKGGK